MNPTFAQKLRVWAPQIVMLLVTDVMALGAYAAQWNYPVIQVQMLIGTAVGGFLLAVTALKKVLMIVDDDRHWAVYLPPEPCKSCASLRADRDELREALATLRLPEVRP